MKDSQDRFDIETVNEAEEQIIEQSKRIEFYLTEYTVELLASKMNNGDFEVPSYQREFTWEAERKSRFIESVIMGLPIPFLFFWENSLTGKLEIVDGSQRLRTIEEFILGNLELGALGELSLLSGFRFKDLPESRQRKIKNRSIRGIVLNEHADEAARLDLFERINTGSKIANPAEVRRGAVTGKFLDIVIELSRNPTFQDLAPVSDKQAKEREREELVTRFFAYGDGLEAYKDHVTPFLFSYTKKMNDYMSQHPEKEEEYRARFLETIAFIKRNFPIGFRRTPKGQATPRARFEAIAIGSFLALRERPELANQDVDIDSWIESQKFKDIISSDGANAINRLKARINFVYDHLLKA
jgi:hypothetical protein